MREVGDEAGDGEVEPVGAFDGSFRRTRADNRVRLRAWQEVEFREGKDGVASADDFEPGGKGRRGNLAFAEDDEQAVSLDFEAVDDGVDEPSRPRPVQRLLPLDIAGVAKLDEGPSSLVRMRRTTRNTCGGGRSGKTPSQLMSIDAPLSLFPAPCTPLPALPTVVEVEKGAAGAAPRASGRAIRATVEKVDNIDQASFSS